MRRTIAMADLPCMCPSPVLGTLSEQQCQDSADGDVRAVLRWLDSGGDVNAANRWGNTLLSLACSNGHVDVVEALLKRPNLHLNLKNRDNDTPLGIAAVNGHWDIVDLLLRTEVRCHIDVHEKSTEEQMTPIMLASEAGEWPLVRVFFEHNYKLREDEAAFVILMAGEYHAWTTILRILRTDYHFAPERFVPVLEAAYEEDAWDVLCAFMRQGFPDRFDDINYWLSKAVLSKKWRGVQELLWLLKKDIILDINLIEAAISDQMETTKKLLEQADHDRDTVDGVLLVVSVAGCTEAVATHLLQHYSEGEHGVILPNCLFLAAMNNHLALLPILLRNHIKCFSYENLSKAQEVAAKCDCSNADRLLQKALEMKTKDVFQAGGVGKT